MTQDISAVISKATLRASRKGRVKLNPAIGAVAQYLMDRNYRSAELAFELKLPAREFWRVREWCRRGLPHTHDATGHLLVNGHVFRDWVLSQSKRARPKQTLAPGQMWCFGCGQSRTPLQVEIVTTGHRPMKRGLCPQGHTMTQWITRRGPA
jgi:hypothetical protein